MRGIWIAIVCALSFASFASSSGCGANTIEIAGPSLRADPVPRSLSYESKRPGGPLATLSSAEARAAAHFLDAHPFEQLGCSAAAKTAANCADGADCSQEIAALDECLALASLRLRGDDIMVRAAVGQGPLSPRECAQLSQMVNKATIDELFAMLPDTRRAECAGIMAVTSKERGCSSVQVVQLNRCFAELANIGGPELAMPLVPVLEMVGDLHSAQALAERLRADSQASLNGLEMSLPTALAVPSSLESRVINGLADFLADRAREEGLDYLAETVGQTLCERSVQGVHVSSFFPEMCRLLRGRDGQADVGLTQFGSALQKALERDLRGLLPVMLNHATSKLDETQWRGLGDFLEEVMAAATDGTAPELDALLKIGRDKIACDGGLDHACALQLLCSTALAIIESRQSDACQDMTWGATCIAAATSKVNKALESQPKLKKWLEDRIPADSDQRLRLIRELMDQLVEIEHARGRGEPTIGQFLALLRTGVEVVVPAGQRERVHLLLGQLENGVVRWGELGYVVYHVTDAILGGQEPMRALVAAAEKASCTSTTDDVGCGVRASGYVASALLSLKASWPKADSPPGDVTRFLLQVEKRLALAIGHADNATLRAWLRTRFAIAVAPGSVTDKVPLINVVEQLLGELRSLEAAIEKARKPEADRLVAVADILSASATLLRSVMSMTIESEATRARALRVINGIVEASAAVSKRELAPFMAALYALAVDLGVPDPLPERVRKYVPFVTALTTAQSSDQVAAAFERYAAPVGGYKAKKQPGFHFTASALVGMAGGVEHGMDFDGTIDSAVQLSAFTPVGVDFTFGTEYFPGWGVMLSVLDVGALTATRIENDEVADADVALKQVFSPGAYLRVPLMGPAVLGAGVSLVPGLRRPTEDGQAETIVRGLVFFAIDVTIFPF